MQSTYQHIQTRKDGSKIADPSEFVDNHKEHTCDKYIKEKSVNEFVIYGSKYNPKLFKECRFCHGYRRFENERRKRGEFKEEWYWNGHLIRRYK